MKEKTTDQPPGERDRLDELVRNRHQDGPSPGFRTRLLAAIGEERGRRTLNLPVPAAAGILAAFFAAFFLAASIPGRPDPLSRAVSNLEVLTAGPAVHTDPIIRAQGGRI